MVPWYTRSSSIHSRDRNNDKQSCQLYIQSRKESLLFASCEVCYMLQHGLNTSAFRCDFYFSMLSVIVPVLLMICVRISCGRPRDTFPYRVWLEIRRTFQTTPTLVKAFSQLLDNWISCVRWDVLSWHVMVTISHSDNISVFALIYNGALLK